MIGLAADKVERHTHPEINKRIHRQTDRSITYFKHHKSEVGERLQELEQEWTIDRIAQTMGGVMAVLGAILTIATGKKRFAAMSLTSGSFLLMYSIIGWAPPHALLRRWGVRSAREIDDERCALAVHVGEQH